MPEKTLTGVILDERVELSLNELSRACSVSTEWIVELVGEGVLEPAGERRMWPGTAIFLTQIVFCLAAAATSPQVMPRSSEM